MESLDDVKAGHEVLVTRGQQPVARLVSMRPEPPNRPRSILDLPSFKGHRVLTTVITQAELAEEMFARG
jgi:antitoxin (DNA-binding transcriptional repressor) of toxin-antitoxin stability system